MTGGSRSGGSAFPTRQHAYALFLHYGLGVVACWQLAEDLALGNQHVHSGVFYPERQVVPLGGRLYAGIVAAQALLLLLHFLRAAPGPVALSLSALIFLDNLGSFLNHRLLLSIQFLLLGLSPVPARGSRVRLQETGNYWGMCVMRYHLSLVYLVAGIHKLNPQFLSGETVRNILVMVELHEMKDYPDWFFRVVESRQALIGLAGAAVIAEFALPVALNFRRTLWIGLCAAVAFHGSLAVIMPYVKIFSLQAAVSLVVFVPDRLPESGRYVLRVPARKFRLARTLRPLFWRGTVSLRSGDDGWAVRSPTGERLGRVEGVLRLMSLSPVTFIAAEVGLGVAAALSVRRPKPADREGR